MYKYILTFFILFTFTLWGADWLSIQGLQSNNSKQHNLWGFAQVRHVQTEGSEFEKNGVNLTPFSLNKPDLTQSKSTGIARFRIGLRGKIDENNKINYFFLTEFGQNGVTEPAGHSMDNYITDASVTLRYLPVNIRIGQFKYPGSEEGLMARFVSPFIQFTTLSDQLLLERFINPSQNVGTTYIGEPAYGVGGYRDIGVELFYKQRFTDSDSLSYAYMLGLGTGTTWENNNDSKPTHYGYLSYEKLFGKGKGYHTESFKLYAWLQQGKRKLANEFYDRKRLGLGMSYFYNGFRLESEYIQGEGMIYSGAKDVDTTQAKEEWHFAMETDDKNSADGYYVASTYEVLDGIEVLARYDRYNRMTNSKAKERVFKNVTLGASYRFKGFNRVDLNYEVRDMEAPYNDAAQNVLDHSGNVLRVQLTLVYK